MAKGPKKLSKSITEKWAMFKLKKGWIVPESPKTCRIKNEEWKKPEPTWRNQEIHKESKKTFGVHVRLEIGFNFPSFSFLMWFSNRLCIKLHKSMTCTERLATPYICVVWQKIEIKHTHNTSRKTLTVVVMSVASHFFWTPLLAGQMLLASKNIKRHYWILLVAPQKSKHRH
jgi:hypothetical protein